MKGKKVGKIGTEHWVYKGQAKEIEDEYGNFRGIVFTYKEDDGDLVKEYAKCSSRRWISHGDVNMNNCIVTRCRLERGKEPAYCRTISEGQIVRGQVRTVKGRTVNKLKNVGCDTLKTDLDIKYLCPV